KLAAPRAQPDAGLEAAWRELQAILDEELRALPAHYQAPLVLCYLEGKTHEQAARQLGWPVGTVAGRVARARELLRARLARRGLAFPAAALATALAADVVRAAPARLLGPTLNASLAYAAGDLTTAAVTPRCAALADGGKTMAATKAKLGLALSLVLGVAAA